MNAMTRLLPPNLQTKHYPVIVIGGGQAGLSASWHLKQRGIAHVVFEKQRIAHEWRNHRWDSFCLVTPNWQCTLPGFPYQGSDPYGFMLKDEIVEYIEAFVASFDPPVLEGVAVTRLSRTGSGYQVTTSIGEYTADEVIVASGAYQVPVKPACAERLPPAMLQMHAPAYRNPQALPEGAVLIVGTGQSGCQIAEDLHLAGRKVHLCVGGAPRAPRRYRGKDAVEWLNQMGYYDIGIDEHPNKDRVRSKSNHYLTGRDGGREIDLRKFASEGMELYGRLDDIRGTTLHLKPDLEKNLDSADTTLESIKDSIDAYITKAGIDAPTEPRYVPVWKPEAERNELDFVAAGISTVIWCIGYRSDYRWIDVPVFDGRGYPGHDRGITTVPGLYFIGLPWQYTWGSGRFSGVARDAQHIVERIASRLHSNAPRAMSGLNALALGS